MCNFIALLIFFFIFKLGWIFKYLLAVVFLNKLPLAPVVNWTQYPLMVITSKQIYLNPRISSTDQFIRQIFLEPLVWGKYSMHMKESLSSRREPKSLSSRSMKEAQGMKSVTIKSLMNY